MKYGPDGNVLPHRLVRQASLPRRQTRNLGPHQWPHLQGQLPRHARRSRASIWRNAPMSNSSNIQRLRTSGMPRTRGEFCRSGHNRAGATRLLDHGRLGVSHRDGKRTATRPMDDLLHAALELDRGKCGGTAPERTCGSWAARFISDKPETDVARLRLAADACRRSSTRTAIDRHRAGHEDPYQPP